jgi:branched-chain amino acid transport system permease protein
MSVSAATPSRSLTPRTRRRLIYGGAGIVIAVLLALVPYMGFGSIGILGGNINSPGAEANLTLCLTIAALAVSFDLMMGYTGLISFGHALFFALGGYGFAMTLTLTDAGFWPAVLVGLGVSVGAAIVVNAIALKSTLIAFAMITLAFGQLLATVIGQNYLSTGGENGIPLPGDRLPTDLVGVLNSRYTYWLSLGLLIVVVAVVSWLVSTRMGRVWQAIRENELRVSVMGLNVYAYKLASASIASALAGLCGIVYVIAIGTADPSVTELFYSIGIVLMVLIGGKGRVWGAALGGVIYTLLQQRLPVLAQSNGVANLPAFIRVPLEGPQIIIGVLFIIFVLAAPGGLAELITKIPRLFRRRGAAPGEPGTEAPVLEAATTSTTTNRPE